MMAKVSAMVRKKARIGDQVEAHCRPPNRPLRAQQQHRDQDDEGDRARAIRRRSAARRGFARGRRSARRSWRPARCRCRRGSRRQTAAAAGRSPCSGRICTSTPVMTPAIAGERPRRSARRRGSRCRRRCRRRRRAPGSRLTARIARPIAVRVMQEMDTRRPAAPASTKRQQLVRRGAHAERRAAARSGAPGEIGRASR